MSEKERTPWFPVNIQPDYVGVYEIAIGNSDEADGFMFWDGARWGYYGFSPEDARACGHTPTGYASIKWRGLAKDPSAP